MWRLILCQVFADGRSLSGWCLDDVFAIACMRQAIREGWCGCTDSDKKCGDDSPELEGPTGKNVQTRKRVPLAECGRATHRVISKPSAPRSSSLSVPSRETGVRPGTTRTQEEIQSGQSVLLAREQELHSTQRERGPWGGQSRLLAWPHRFPGRKWRTS